MDDKTYEHEYKPYGELEYCFKCMGLEGSMTTDCSGEPMSPMNTEAVYSGHLNFYKETGWTEALSPMGENRVQSHFYKVTNKLSGHEGKTMEDIYDEYPTGTHPYIVKLIKQLFDFEEDRARAK